MGLFSLKIPCSLRDLELQNQFLSQNSLISRSKNHEDPNINSYVFSVLIEIFASKQPQARS